MLGASLAFGLLAAWAKGTGGGHGLPEARSVLGNLSMPWVLLAFVAGTRFAKLRSGVLVGFAATMVALTGFYVYSSIVQDLGGHGFVGDLRLELTANRGYLEGGVVTGPLFGALGAWWQSRRRLSASVVAGVLLMAEPLVLVLLGSAGPGHVLSSGSGMPLAVRLVPGWGLTSSSDATAIAVYSAEFVLGVGVLLLARLRFGRSAGVHASQ